MQQKILDVEKYEKYISCAKPSLNLVLQLITVQIFRHYSTDKEKNLINETMGSFVFVHWKYAVRPIRDGQHMPMPNLQSLAVTMTLLRLQSTSKILKKKETSENKRKMCC